MSNERWITFQVLSEVREKRDEKKKELEKQLQIIQEEKAKVDQDVQVCPQNLIDRFKDFVKRWANSILDFSGSDIDI